MLTIAVTGPKGSGKSTLLGQFAEEIASQGHKLDGFITLGIERDDPNRGARNYTVKMLADGSEHIFATRAEACYDIVAETTDYLAEWVKTLQPTEVLILDEFGRWEADGEGHMHLWEPAAATLPKLVILGVRMDSLGRIEERIGRTFDFILDAADPASLARLIDITTQRPDWERVGQFGAAAGALELTLGTALHTVKFPLTGITMSTAQAGVLTVAGDGLSRKSRVVWAGVIASGLKALSPSGSKLGPMLAITMQAWLFMLSTAVAGWSALGVFLGGALMGAWASSQGFFVQYLMLGGDMKRAYDEVTKWVSHRVHLQMPGMVAVLSVVVLINALLAGMAAYVMWKRRSRLHAHVATWLQNPEHDPVQRAKSKWAWLSMIIPTVLVGAVLLASGSKWTDIALVVGRAFAVGLLLYGVVQRWDPIRLIGFLKRKGLWGPSYALESAMKPRDPGQS